MPTIWGHRYGYTIVPYQKFMEDIEAFPEGVRLRIKIDTDRNGKFSALYHLMLGKVVKAINAGPAKTDIKTLKEFIKLKRGWFEVVDLPAPLSDGTKHAIHYHSTAFAAMPEREFHQFCVDSCDMIRHEMAPWINQSAEWPEIQSIINSIAPEET